MPKPSLPTEEAHADELAELLVTFPVERSGERKPAQSKWAKRRLPFLEEAVPEPFSPRPPKAA